MSTLVNLWKFLVWATQLDSTVHLGKLLRTRDPIDVRFNGIKLESFSVRHDRGFCYVRLYADDAAPAHVGCLSSISLNLENGTLCVTLLPGNRVIEMPFAELHRIEAITSQPETCTELRTVTEETARVPKQGRKRQVCAPPHTATLGSPRIQT